MSFGTWSNEWLGLGTTPNMTGARLPNTEIDLIWFVTHASKGNIWLWKGRDADRFRYNLIVFAAGSDSGVGRRRKVPPLVIGIQTTQLFASSLEGPDDGRMCSAGGGMKS